MGTVLPLASHQLVHCMRDLLEDSALAMPYCDFWWVRVSRDSSASRRTPSSRLANRPMRGKIASRDIVFSKAAATYPDSSGSALGRSRDKAGMARSLQTRPAYIYASPRV